MATAGSAEEPCSSIRDCARQIGINDTRGLLSLEAHKTRSTPYAEHWYFRGFLQEQLYDELTAFSATARRMERAYFAIAVGLHKLPISSYIRRSGPWQC